MAPKTIMLKTRAMMIKEWPVDAGDDITPGDLLEFVSTTDEVQPHSSAAGVCRPLMVAAEAAIDGRGIDDDYDEDGEACFVIYPDRGDELYMWLSPGETAAIGSLLESNGDGALQVGSTAPYFRSLEALDLAAIYVNTRIKVEVI